MSSPLHVDAAVRLDVTRRPELSETLRHLYPRYEPLEFGGLPLPITIFPAPVSSWPDLEDALEALDPRPLAPRGVYAREFDPGLKPVFHYHQRTQDPRTKFDGRVFAFERMRIGDDRRPRIHARPGRYFESLTTCEELDAELFLTLATDPGSVAGLDDLPHRAWLHERMEDPVLDGRHRGAGLSIATVLMLRSEDGFDVMLSPRSSEVATNSLQHHVIPSGLFSPLDDPMTPGADEFSIRRSLLREYVEELYSIEEYEVGSAAVHDPEAEPEVQRLLRMIRNGEAHLAYSGVSVNLLSLRPEICTVLVIEKSGWLRQESEAKRPLKPAWEYLARSAEGELPPGSSHTTWLSLHDDLSPDLDSHGLSGANFVPGAAAAIALAAPVARALASEA